MGFIFSFDYALVKFYLAKMHFLNNNKYAAQYVWREPFKARDMNQQNKDQKGRNTDKDQNSNSANEPTPIYLTDDSTLQTPEEYQHDKSQDPRKNTTFETSEDDLHETDVNRES
jgi:hypothetical protein